MLVLPVRHIDSGFGKDDLRGLYLDAVDAGQVNARDAIEFLLQVGLGDMFAARQGGRLGERLRRQVDLGSQGLQVGLDAAIAFGDVVEMKEIQIMHLAQHEQEIFSPMPFQAWAISLRLACTRGPPERPTDTGRVRRSRWPSESPGPTCRSGR